MTQVIQLPYQALNKAFINVGLQLGLTQFKLGSAIGKHHSWAIAALLKVNHSSSAILFVTPDPRGAV